jgi:serine protease Do/serine protease DegQ
VANLKSGSPRGKVEGVLVTKADANSPAWQHGLRPGDIIVGVNRRKIRTVQEFLAVLQMSENVIVLNLLRGDFRLTLVIQ